MSDLDLTAGIELRRLRAENERLRAELAAQRVPGEVREAAMRASAWLMDMLNDYRGDGMGDLLVDVIVWRRWLDNLPTTSSESEEE